MNRRVIAKWAKTLDPFWTVGENLLVLQAEATKKKTSVTVRTDQIVTTLLFPSPTVIIIKPNAYGQVQILGWISYAKMMQKQKPDPKWSKSERYAYGPDAPLKPRLRNYRLQKQGQPR